VKENAALEHELGMDQGPRLRSKYLVRRMLMGMTHVPEVSYFDPP